MGEYLTANSSLAIPNKLSLYRYGRNQPVMMLDPDGRDEIYYDQKGNETKRVETTVWNRPSTWQDKKFVQGNKPGQWWPTHEEITPGSISGVVDEGVESKLNNFVTSQKGEANTLRKGNHANAIGEVMKKSPQGADWDYKRPLRRTNGVDKLYVLDGEAYRDDYIGNVAWGSIMKHKGFPLSAARAGAGAYQVQQDVRNLQIPTTLDRILTNPIGAGDDRRDTRAIEHGYARTP